MSVRKVPQGTYEMNKENEKMKKIFALLLALCMVFALAACGQPAAPAATEAPAPAPTEAPAPAPTEVPAEPTEAPVEPTEAPVEAPAVMSYAEYAAAAVDDPVTVRVCVQAHQSWWDNKITVYAADEDGAYFLYNMACSEEDAAKLNPGQWILVSGFKGEWAGEVEVVDASFEFLPDEPYSAKANDVTGLLGTDELIAHQNEFVSFTGVTIADKGDGQAFLYKWDGSGSQGDDLYFDVIANGETYTFTVESYLCDKDSLVYQTVENFQVGDVVDLEGFLYWYEGPNPHITAVKPPLPIMSYAEYDAAEMDEAVVIDTYVQAHQSWWDGKITVYAQAPDGAVFAYNMACTEAEAARLVPGQKIRISGFKSVWSGEVEIVDASFIFVYGDSFIAEPEDVTALLGTDELAAHQNQLVSVTGAVIADKGDGQAFLYKWDGSGQQGDDLYFDVIINGETYTFTVESYLCGKDTEVYQAIEALQVGDTVDLVGFLYWYEGPQPHITAVTVK